MALPRAYDRWLGATLGPLPTESLATCSSCAMQAPAGAAPAAGTMFFGDAKCCTYYPSLPSFQVGGILRDATIPEGARRIAAKIASRVNVDPLCVRADRRRAELYKIGVAAGFGRAETFRCPYYADGGCSVWPYREAVCSTYFCKLERPVKGRELWSSLRSLLHLLETTVVVHCATELGIAPAIIDELAQDAGMKSPADVDAVADPVQHARLWGTWLDREEAYYRACADIADGLDLAALRKLGGLAFERRLDMTRAAFDAVASRDLPARLRAAPMLQITPSQPGSVQIHVSANHPVQMPAVVVEVLSYFQGQPVAEANATLAEQGFDIHAGFLERLYDYGFLVE